MLSPGLLGGDDVATDGFVLDEEPRFVEEEHLEGGELPGVGNLVRRAVEDVEQQGLQHIRRITPSREIECLEASGGETIFGIVERRSRTGPPCVQR